VAVSFSCIQGLTGILGGAGNTGENPRFLDADGLDDVVVGVPCKLGDGGLKQIIELKLTEEENAELKKSAAIVQENIKVLGAN